MDYKRVYNINHNLNLNQKIPMKKDIEVSIIDINIKIEKENIEEIIQILHKAHKIIINIKEETKIITKIIKL